MAGNKDFAELLKEVCDELIQKGEDINKYGTIVIDSLSSLEPSSYYTTYYGQDVATTGQARGYFRYINDGHYGVNSKGGRQLIAKSDYEVDLI